MGRDDSESSDYSYERRSRNSNKDDCYTSSQYDTTDNGSRYCSDSYDKCKSDRCDSTRCDSRSDRCDSRSDRCKPSDSECGYDCGIKRSDTLVGVWNFIYSCGDACTTDGNMEWINQVLMNADGTVTFHSAPDVGNNPYPCMLTNSIGVWRRCGDERKVEMELTNIGYRCADGCAQAYYRTKMRLKINRRGNRLRFYGEACPYDISDPKMCTPVDHKSLCFDGCGVKVLEP